MIRRWIGWAVWLALTACLYFFENNTGTRACLLCSLLFPFVPFLRRAFFSADEADKAETLRPQTVKSFILREADESGDVRLYRTGDPVRRIHWKLSAKKDELLVRETAAKPETAQETGETAFPAADAKKTGKRRALGLVLGICIFAALLLLIPEANRGAQALCNRLFAASEQVNAYAYAYFPVPEDQPVLLGAFLLLGILTLLTALTVWLQSRVLTLGVMAACTAFQVYFGLSFPAWANIALYGFLALWMMRRPFNRKSLTVYCASVLLVSLLTALLLPGVDAPTEAASEAVRDRLAQAAQQVTGAVVETPAGETETRHIHTLSLETGEEEARSQREYRLVTVEEEQISMPRWIDYLKIAALLLLSAVLVALPFAPFLLLNARKRKAREERKAFDSDNTSEAVRAVFQAVIVWLEETGCQADNRLYREWADHLPDAMPEGYAIRFSQCAEDFEEASYSDHALPEEKRRAVLDLLKETETALWAKADWKQRLRLKYWMCLCE